MMRLLFTGLAALAVLVAITLWWRPPEPATPELVTLPPLEVELARDPAASNPPPALAKPVAPDSPPTPATSVAPDSPRTPSARPEQRPIVAATPEPASRAELPRLLEPLLEEEAPLVLVERPDFEDGPPGALAAQPRLEPPAAPAPASVAPPAPAGVALPAPAGVALPAPAGVAPPARVDVDRSGELIRRMLALYDAMRG